MNNRFKIKKDCGKRKPVATLIENCIYYERDGKIYGRCNLNGEESVIRDYKTLKELKGEEIYEGDTLEVTF